jgi:hypothetical protein
MLSRGRPQTHARHASNKQQPGFCVGFRRHYSHIHLGASDIHDQEHSRRFAKQKHVLQSMQWSITSTHTETPCASFGCNHKLLDAKKKGSPRSQAPSATSATQLSTRPPQTASASTETETDEDGDRAARSQPRPSGGRLVLSNIPPKQRVAR